MKRILLIGVVAGVLGAWPAGAGAATFHGIVVGKQRGAVLVASPNGLVRAFSGRAAVGSRIAFAGGRLVVVGRARTALLRGIVVRRVGSTMFLSSNRHLVAVHLGRRLASANDSAPTPSQGTTPTTGDTVTTQVAIGANGQLDEEHEDDLGPSNAGSVQVQAVVAAVGTGAVTLTVQGQTLTVPLPAGLTLPASIVGQTVTLNLSLGDQNGQGGDGGNDGGGDGGGDH